MTAAERALPGITVRGRRRAKPLSHYAGRGLIYLLVMIGGGMSMIPFAWAFVSSGKAANEVVAFPPTFWPQNNLFVENYTRIWVEAPFLLWIRNSAVITSLTLIGAIASASVVAYAFARFEFPGRNTWFFIMLSTMMLPGEVTLIPSFLIFNALGWVDTFKPLIVPAWFGGAFNIFLLRQFYMTIPRDLDEAAEIDGANPLTVFIRVLLPLTKPAIATAAALGFISSWNSFMGPLIYLNNPDRFTAVLGLRHFMQGVTSAQLSAGPPQDNLLMAASIVVALPCLILFFVAQKYFVQGIVTTGLKG